MSNEQIPPTFQPKKITKQYNSNAKKIVIVGKEKHITHCQKNKNTDNKNNENKLEKISKAKNEINNRNLQDKNSEIPPTFTPKTQQKPKENLVQHTSSSTKNNYNNKIHENHFSKPTISKAQHFFTKNQNNNHIQKPIAQKILPKKLGLKKKILTGIAVILVLMIVWPSYLFYRASSQLQTLDAISQMPKNTQGTTWLIVGSDSRQDSHIQDGTKGERADSIILLHKAPNGTAAIVSIPRDTFVNIPGHGANKINASYYFGGPKLLVETVEGLTNIKIDHYTQIGMSGVQNLVDSVGGINLCLDYDVNDPKSELVWKAGCHDADGKTSLAFARMRYSDPLGDFGRTMRQRQVISKLMSKIFTPSTLLNPFTQVALVDAGSTSVKSDHDSNVLDIGYLALAFKQARNNNLNGLPPIQSINHKVRGASTVLLNKAMKDVFFEKMKNGTLSPEDFHKF